MFSIVQLFFKRNIPPWTKARQLWPLASTRALAAAWSSEASLHPSCPPLPDQHYYQPKGRMAKVSEKFQEGGGGIFNPKIFVWNFGPLNRAFWTWNWYKFATWFSKNEGVGGVQRPFRTFPKIHPSSCGHPSLLLWPKHADVKTTSSSPSPSLKSARSATLPTLRLPIWSSLSWEEAVQIAVLYLVVMPFGVYM